MAEVNNKIAEENRKKCKHCKKFVSFPRSCEVCSSDYHPSCAIQAKVLNKENKVICCQTRRKSEVTSEENLNDQEMDEKKIKSIVKELFAEYLEPFKKSMKEDMSEVKKSVQYMSDVFDDQKSAVDKMLDEIKHLKEENGMLKQRIKTIEDKMNNREQIEKQNNLVVTGIPKQQEDTKSVVEKVLKTMKVQVNDRDIQGVYSISKKDGAPIMIECKNQDIKKNIINRVKQLKGLKVRECGLVGTDKNIYFNDDLTHQNQLLYKMARDFRRINKLKSAYVTNGKIYLRQGDTDPPKRIRSEADLRL